MLLFKVLLLLQPLHAFQRFHGASSLEQPPVAVASVLVPAAAPASLFSGFEIAPGNGHEHVGYALPFAPLYPWLHDCATGDDTSCTAEDRFQALFTLVELFLEGPLGVTRRGQEGGAASPASPLPPGTVPLLGQALYEAVIDKLSTGSTQAHRLLTFYDQVVDGLLATSACVAPPGPDFVSHDPCWIHPNKLSSDEFLQAPRLLTSCIHCNSDLRALQLWGEDFRNELHSPELRLIQQELATLRAAAGDFAGKGSRGEMMSHVTHMVFVKWLFSGTGLLQRPLLQRMTSLLGRTDRMAER